MGRNNDFVSPYKTYVPAVALVISLVVVWYFGKQELNAATTNVKNAKQAIAKNDSLRTMYLGNADAVRLKQFATKRRDSLRDANCQLFNVAQEKYFDRIDKNYTLGRFFDAQQIAELNKILVNYLTRRAGDSSFEYKFAKSNMPVNAKTTLNMFIDIIIALDVAPQDLAPLDVIFDGGQLCAFNDKHAETVFESFLEDSDAGKMHDDGPNFDLPEMAQIRDKYVYNVRRIDSLGRVITQQDAVIKNAVRQFDNRKDSLQRVIKENEHVLQQ